MFADATLRTRVPVVVLVADGARVDALTGDLADLPALRRLRDEGGLYPVTTVFPSVTGPAYTPFLLGRFPGAVGIPGLRWYDRVRETCSWPDYARSYVGIQFGRIDSDLASDAPTVFDLVPDSIAALSVITRGLARSRRMGTLTMRSVARVAVTHFRGNAETWLDVDREAADLIVRRSRDERPDYVFGAFVGVDKGTHARGHASPLVHEALRIVDDAAARLRADAERDGRWSDMHLWIVSDHGHSPVSAHEDLAGIVADTGVRTVAHPWSAGFGSQVAVMVSGNAMAHLYLDIHDTTRRWWPSLEGAWSALAEVLLRRPAVDLLLLPHSADRCEVRNGLRGTAIVSRRDGRYRYERTSGDPLLVGTDVEGTADETHDLLRDADYPDALVQILALAGSARAGDVILSAAPGWDFRERYEPIPHVSSHGALHRDHMIVPLLTNRPARRIPRRTTDVFASTLAALGVPARSVLDGVSWL